MNLYLLVVFSHIVATLGLFAGLTIEWVTVRFEASKSSRDSNLDQSMAKVVAADNSIGGPVARFGLLLGGDNFRLSSGMDPDIDVGRIDHRGLRRHLKQANTCLRQGDQR
jgi:hypothetical protein